MEILPKKTLAWPHESLFSLLLESKKVQVLPKIQVKACFFHSRICVIDVDMPSK